MIKMYVLNFWIEAAKEEPQRDLSVLNLGSEPQGEARQSPYLLPQTAQIKYVLALRDI